MWPFGKKRDRVDLEQRSPELGIKYKDLMVMDQLAQAGADLEQPRHVIFHLNAPSLDDAQLVAKDAHIAPFGLRVSIGKPTSCESWPVTCETNAVISPNFVRDTGNLFDSIAEQHNADYDGWEAAATP